MATSLTAAAFITRLEALANPKDKEDLQRYFKTAPGEYGAGDTFIGVRMGNLFDLCKEFIDMPVAELEILLGSHIHEARAGALSIMDKSCRRKKTPQARRKEYYDLYLRRHDRINNWDLVDVAALHVIGLYLLDKPRDILYTLARSNNMWERRTAMYATGYFIKHRDLDDTYRIAEILLHDSEDLLQKAVGSWLRHAGTVDRPRLLAFLDQHAPTMPRTTLRVAIEHLDPAERQHYLKKS